MDKITSGYKMLMILAHADGEHLPLESDVIHEYLGVEFDAAFSQSVIEVEAHRLNQLNHEQLLAEFDVAMHAFYRQSTREERARFLQLSMNVIKADANISEEENDYIDHLFEHWETE